jgi:hypothetical protein
LAGLVIDMELKCETDTYGQDQAELQEFIRLMLDNGVNSYLEIGCKHGGSLWRIGNALPKGSRIAAVDLPFKKNHPTRNTQPHLETCVAELRKRKYDIHLFIGDSTDPGVVQRVRALAPFDLCLIDGNHTEPYVRKDWANYGPMARMVAFHDISFIRPPDLESWRKPIEVPKFWNEIKNGYRTVEIKLCPGANGIGILWRSQPG